MKIVYDAKLHRPACVILQVMKGGDPNIANKFPVDSWLVNPTPDMKLYLVNEEQLHILIKIAKENS